MRIDSHTFARKQAQNHVQAHRCLPIATMGFVRMNHAFGQRFRAHGPGAIRTKGAVCLMAPAPDNRVFLCLVLLNSPISLGKITPTTLIPLGRPDSTRPLDGMSPLITWTLYASNGSATSLTNTFKSMTRERKVRRLCIFRLVKKRIVPVSGDAPAFGTPEGYWARRQCS